MYLALISILLLLFSGVASAGTCENVICGTIDGQQAACFVLNDGPNCCVNGQCEPTGSRPVGPATPVPTPTPVAGSGPPEPFSAYAASCPEQPNIVDAANGVVEINCPDVTIDCSQLTGRVVRKFLITPMMTWWMSNYVPRSFAGLITARPPGCWLQPLDASTNLQSGEGGVLDSCFFLGGCAPIPLAPFVAVSVVWETTDIYPEITHNQLFAILSGK